MCDQDNLIWRFAVPKVSILNPATRPTHRTLKPFTSPPVEGKIDYIIEPSHDIIELLKGNRSDELKAFSVALSSAQMIKIIQSDDGQELFSDILMLAIKDYGVRQKDLAESINVNQATISRWATKQACPTHVARPAILNAIATLINHEVIANT